MARINGDAILVTDDGVTFAHATNAVLNIEQELLDATTKDSSRWKEHIRGDRSATIDVEGLVDFGNSTGGFEGLEDMISDGATSSIVFKGSTSGDLTYTGTCDVSSLSMNAPHNGVVSYSGTLQVTGTLTPGTVA